MSASISTATMMSLEQAKTAQKERAVKIRPPTSIKVLAVMVEAARPKKMELTIPIARTIQARIFRMDATNFSPGYFSFI